jgi:ABC-type sugar transport system substrate-binding protein
MIKRFALLLASAAAVAALAAPLAAAQPPTPQVCTYVPDLDGHLYGPYCFPR